MLRSGIRVASATAIMALATGAGASAQRLLEKDGIELRGTARVVTFAAGKCNVLEASHTEAEYERIKANHGQPLDVWQLDFSVHNGSGKWLDHLIARYGIESKWPDCTNWSGPSGTYPEPVEWSSTLGHIQKSGRNVVAPGSTLTDTTFILAFHEDQPRFERWSVDFTFGDSSSLSGAADTGSPPGTPPRSGAEDRLVEGGGDRRQPAGISGEQTCAGLEDGAACWQELASHPGCHVWNRYYSKVHTVTWTGGCSGDQGSGTGTLQWIRGSEVVRDESGLLRNGKQDGYWVTRSPYGVVEEGPIIDNQRNGHWVLRLPDGEVREGPYVDGKQHGDWVITDVDGEVGGGLYVNGKKHGRWIERNTDYGTVLEGQYVNGVQDGRWVLRRRDGDTDVLTFVNGVLQ